MGLWEFLQQWRGGRTAGGVGGSLLLHVLVVAAVLWGARLPIAEKWRAKPGDALIVELPRPEESPAPGVPDAPDAPPSPQAPPIALKSPPPSPPTAARPPAPPPAPRQVASAPRPVNPVRQAEPRPAEPRAAATASPAEAPTERGTDKAPAANEPAPSAPAAAESAPAAPSRAPSGLQVASLPPDGASGRPAMPDIRSALRRGAGGKGAGRGGIEGDAVQLDSRDAPYSDYLEKVRQKIKAQWGYP